MMKNGKYFYKEWLKTVPETILLKMFEKYLTPREKRILEKRLGINGYKFHTLKEAGATEQNNHYNKKWLKTFYPIHQTRVAQIEAKAIRKLRRRELEEMLKIFKNQKD